MSYAEKNNSELLGEVVAWEVDSGSVPYTNVLKALNDADLGQDVATELSPKSAFSRACRDLKKERAIDKVSSDGSVITFQFTKKFLEDNKKMEYDYECMVMLDTESGTVICLESPELEVQAQELLNTAVNTRTSADITRIVQKIFKENGDLFPIAPSKGVAYFTPEEHREFTDKVDKFLRSVGGKLCRFPVPNGTHVGNESVRDAVSDGLNAMIRELNSAVEEWDLTTRGSTMEKASEKWDKIAHKIEAYEYYLGAAQDKLKDELRVAKERLVEKVMSVEEEKEAAKSSDSKAPESTVKSFDEAVAV